MKANWYYVVRCAALTFHACQLVVHLVVLERYVHLLRKRFQSAYDQHVSYPRPHRTILSIFGRVRNVHILQLGLCCCNMECCFKPGAPCLMPFGVCGCKPECDGCSILNLQCHALCAVVSAAIPCNKEVPLAVSILGLTIFPKCGFCMQQKEIMDRD